MSNVNFNLVAFDGEEEHGVDARELHEQLRVGRDFSTWVKDRIDSAQLVEEQDFIRSPIPGSAHKVEYFLSIDSAKHIAMLERTEIGRQIRQYFIEVEKRAKEIHQKSSNDPLLAVLQASTMIRERQIILETKTVELEANQEGQSARLDHIESLIDTSSKFVSVVGWINIKKLKSLDVHEASAVGRTLSSIARTENYELSSTDSEVWGTVNTYPKDFMEKYFEGVYRQVIGSRKAV